jgi:predicted PurR-regulated permease PerM
MAVGLDFGFFIGFLTGIFSFIPYLGMFFGVFIGLIVALFQYGLDFQSLGLVLFVFLFGQFLEGNFISPKIIGDKIGVHPMWIIFGLFAGGVLMGFTGMLIAAPLTGIAGVIVKMMLEEYKQYFVNNKKIKKDKQI